jgi:hypothetical protein
MMDSMIIDRVYDAQDEYSMREEYERALIYAMHDMLDQCQIHGFYLTLSNLFTLCSNEDKVLMLKAISKILENNK